LEQQFLEFFIKLFVNSFEDLSLFTSSAIDVLPRIFKQFEVNVLFLSLVVQILFNQKLTFAIQKQVFHFSIFQIKLVLMLLLIKTLAC